MAHPAAPTLTHDVALHCEDQHGHPMAFMATFAYSEQDPYAVGVTLHLSSGDVPWTIGRCLLQQGLGRPAGDGAVRLAPDVDEDGRAVVRMALHSREGVLRVAARTTELLDFLVRTWLLVPPGAESAQQDVDALIETLSR
jgi:hypothetical protein